MKLTSKLRPSKIETLIIPERIQKILFNSELNQNYIFHGTAGIGKTSTAYILAKMISGDVNSKAFNEETSICLIDATNEGVVDTVRDVLEPFCMSRSFNSKKVKTVIFDEFDRASSKFYDILKGFIEKYEDNVRFIATCNNINKIPEPIISRFKVLNFNAINTKEKEEVTTKIEKRIERVLTKFEISFGSQELKTFVSKKYPDIRSMYNDIQEMSESGVKDLSSYLSVIATDGEKISQDIHRIVSDSSISPKDLYHKVYENFGNDIEGYFDIICTDYMLWMVKDSSLCTKIPYMLPKVQWYQSTKQLVPDPFLHTLSLIFDIRQILFG